jgi:hypothetical protein
LAPAIIPIEPTHHISGLWTTGYTGHTKFISTTHASPNCKGGYDLWFKGYAQDPWMKDLSRGLFNFAPPIQYNIHVHIDANGTVTSIGALTLPPKTIPLKGREFRLK